MAFPYFQPSRPSILFFSRGRGRGHAVPDLEIARQIIALRPEVQIHFVSYGTGGATIAARGWPLVDLGLPDDNSTAVTVVHAGRLIGALQPDLVVSHEEYAALPAAAVFGRRALLLTDFFGEDGSFWMECQWFAERILFLDHRGLHPEPASAKGRTTYLRPVLRDFSWRRSDRRRARRELGLAEEGRVIGVMPGSWTEARAPLAERLLRALPSGDQLVWLAGSDALLLKQMTSGRPRTTVLEHVWEIDRLMCACDLVVTKCNRMTVRELAALGIRTLSVSYGRNAADERSIAGLRNNRTLQPRQLTATALRRAMAEPEPRPVRWRAASCADEILRRLEPARTGADSQESA